MPTFVINPYSGGKGEEISSSSLHELHNEFKTSLCNSSEMLSNNKRETEPTNNNKTSVQGFPHHTICIFPVIVHNDGSHLCYPGCQGPSFLAFTQSLSQDLSWTWGYQPRENHQGLLKCHALRMPKQHLGTAQDPSVPSPYLTHLLFIRNSSMVRTTHQPQRGFIVDIQACDSANPLEEQ